MRVGVQNIGPFVKGGDTEIPAYKIQDGGREVERRNWVLERVTRGSFRGKRIMGGLTGRVRKMGGWLQQRGGLGRVGKGWGGITKEQEDVLRTGCLVILWKVGSENGSRVGCH